MVLPDLVEMTGTRRRGGSTTRGRRWDEQKDKEQSSLDGLLSLGEDRRWGRLLLESKGKLGSQKVGIKFRPGDCPPTPTLSLSSPPSSLLLSFLHLHPPLPTTSSTLTYLSIHVFRWRVSWTSTSWLVSFPFDSLLARSLPSLHDPAPPQSTSPTVQTDQPPLNSSISLHLSPTRSLAEGDLRSFDQESYRRGEFISFFQPALPASLFLSLLSASTTFSVFLT